jgi:hypothetical protein
MGNVMSSFTVGGATYNQPYALQNVSIDWRFLSELIRAFIGTCW